jgi:sporulation protein YlmC with PRC-barrel domain
MQEGVFAMAQRAEKLLGSRVWTQNGPVGRIKDILFDDRQWIIEHLVVEIHRWLPLGQVLVEPSAVMCPSGEGKTITPMTREELRRCPSASVRLPLAKRKKLVKQVKRMGFSKIPVGKRIQSQGRPVLRIPEEDSHLRSASSTIDYRIQARDGDIGLVEDIEMNPAQWCVEGFVVKKGRAGICSRDVIPTELIDDISFIRKSVMLTSTKDDILHALKNADRP